MLTRNECFVTLGWWLFRFLLLFRRLSWTETIRWHSLIKWTVTRCCESIRPWERATLWSLLQGVHMSNLQPIWVKAQTSAQVCCSHRVLVECKCDGQKRGLDVWKFLWWFHSMRGDRPETKPKSVCSCLWDAGTFYSLAIRQQHNEATFWHAPSLKQFLTWNPLQETVC